MHRYRRKRTTRIRDENRIRQKRSENNVDLFHRRVTKVFIEIFRQPKSSFSLSFSSNLFIFGLILIVFFLLKKRQKQKVVRAKTSTVDLSKRNQTRKSNSLTIHHDVRVRFSNSLSAIPCRYDARRQLDFDRNLNGQTLTGLVFSSIEFNSSNNDDKQTNLLKISPPLFDHCHLMKKSSSTVSFDSQLELNRFKRMSTIENDFD